MKVLIIGNRYHQFIYNYVEALKRYFKSTELSIDILSQESTDISFLSDAVYNNIYILKVNSLLRRNRITRSLMQQLLFRKYINGLNNYDIVHIHYVENIILRDVCFFSKHIRGKLIVSIWGSDFLRASDLKRKSMAILLERADKITIASDQIIKEFCYHYREHSFLSKVELCRFGLKPLENLIALFNDNNSISNCKKEIGLSNDKIVITIGYNASRLQHHIKIIDEITNYLPLNDFCSQIEFLVPLTYPNDTAYVAQIKELIRDSKYKFVIIDNFLSDVEVARVRRASDIFIQLQPTDMLSGSMLEHLASGNIVITGSWLPYGCLDEWGVFYKKIDNIDMISAALYEVLSNYSIYQEKCKNNSTSIVEKFRWKNVVNNWINIYEQ